MRSLIFLPNPLLRERSNPVGLVNDDIRTLADDMLETMRCASGIGLAAIQVGEPVRLLVLDLLEKGVEHRDVFINPEIVWASKEHTVYEEGCLSIPNYYAEVERPKQVCVNYLDRCGRLKELQAEGLLATCLQHEIDHLDGILFIDYLSRLKRNMIIRKLRKKLRSEERCEKH
ncbi:MAG: peptide deformylase [Candidatus Tokpelaia sp. JSC161]|jgi:peptide deformylase|nr:MAG: peptide deformylase [Candidatus Tokpelaia sp. JSC161]